MKCQRTAVTLLTVLIVISTPGCSRDADAASDKPAVTPAAARPAPAPAPDGTLFELAGRFGSPAALWCEVGYKVKRKSGVTTKSLELEVDNAAAGTTYPVTVDGFAAGTITTNAKGDAKFELVENKEQLFPQGFREPAAGALIRVGELLQVRLDVLNHLVGLEATVAGAGKLGGKVTYKAEQVGDTVTKEFTVKVTGAPPKTSLPVELAGVAVGSLTIDVEGQGRLKFSNKKPPPFPAGFPEPTAGAAIHIGDLFAGTLQEAR